MQRLTELNQRLDEVRQAGEDAYLAAAWQRAATERWLLVAVQICVDLCTQLVTEQSTRPPSNYAEVFEILGEKGVIAIDLAQRLADAAKQHGLIMHLYLEIDDRSVFASLAHLDDLREFAASLERLARLVLRFLGRERCSAPCSSPSAPCRCAVVVTTGEEAYRRTDGIAVVPAGLIGV